MKRNTKKMYSVSVAIALAGSVVAGCSSSSSTSSPSPSAAAATKAPEATAAATAKAAGLDISKKVELQFYMLGPAPKDLPVIEEEINKLALKDLNATVKFNFTTWTDWDQKYKLITIIRPSGGFDLHGGLDTIPSLREKRCFPAFGRSAS